MNRAGEELYRVSVFYTSGDDGLAGVWRTVGVGPFPWAEEQRHRLYAGGASAVHVEFAGWQEPSAPPAPPPGRRKVRP